MVWGVLFNIPRMCIVFGDLGWHSSRGRWSVDWLGLKSDRLEMVWYRTCQSCVLDDLSWRKKVRVYTKKKKNLIHRFVDSPWWICRSTALSFEEFNEHENHCLLIGPQESRRWIKWRGCEWTALQFIFDELNNSLLICRKRASEMNNLSPQLQEKAASPSASPRSLHS